MSLTRPDLSGEAIRLGRLLSGLMPEPEVTRLLALMLLQDSRRVARTSPAAELNRAVAVAMRDAPEAGLRLIDALLSRGQLADYHLAHSARADLYRRLGKTAESRSSYEKALALTQLEPERRFLENRLRELG